MNAVQAAAGYGGDKSRHDTDGGLVGAAHRYDELQRQLRLLEDLSRETRTRRELIEELDRHWQERKDSILEEMTALTWNAVSQRSTGPDHWRAKAHILLDWCIPQDGDIVHSLAASLCKDICEMWREQEPGKGTKCNCADDDKPTSIRTGEID